MSIERIVGIDFGTSTSQIGVKTYKDGQPIGDKRLVSHILFGDTSDTSTVPSLVFETENGEYYCGYETYAYATRGTLYHNFKLDLLSPDAGKRKMAEKLISLFFTHLYKKYDEQKSYFPKCDKETTYVSYPANWPEYTRDFLLKATAGAGFKNVKGVDEPIVDFYSVFVQGGIEPALLDTTEQSDGIHILTINMEADNTDMALFNYNSDRETPAQLLATWPLVTEQNFLGGKEIDEKLCEYTKQFLISHGLGIKHIKYFEQCYMDEIKSWKENNLLPTLTRRNVVDYCAFVAEILERHEIAGGFPPLDRAKFEALIYDYIKQFVEMVNSFLTYSFFKEPINDKIDFVILSGEYSQWYFADEILAGEMKHFGEVNLPKIRSNKARIINLESKSSVFVHWEEQCRHSRKAVAENTGQKERNNNMPTKNIVERLVGIDFGTSTSLIKVKTYKNGQSMGDKVLADYISFGTTSDTSTVPSLVYKTLNGEYYCGYEAAYATKGTPYRNFKLELLSPDAEKRETAEKLTALFFKHLYIKYDGQKAHFPKCDQETTYVSYPAKWPQETREFMLKTAKDAGFVNVHGLDEPSAAIHTVAVKKAEIFPQSGFANGQDIHILMVDMGAGTTDLALCRYNSTKQPQVEILFTWPDDTEQIFFGGREIDEKLCEYTKQFLTDLGLPIRNYEQHNLEKSKTWKENNISPMLKTRNIVACCAFVNERLENHDVDTPFPPLNRVNFEYMIYDYLTQFPKLVNDCLEQAVKKGEIAGNGSVDFVILTGGHSQWYFAYEMLTGEMRNFGEINLPKIINNRERVIRLSSPQETVGYGLVYQRLAAQEPILKPDPKPVPKPASNHGNSVGNIVNGGFVALHGDCIYYSNMGIYKIRTDGSGKKKLNDDYYSSNLNVVDDWIYYKNYSDNGKIYRIRTDGSSREKITNDSGAFLNVVGDWIYYSDYYNNRIYRIRTDGSVRIKINDDKSFYLNVVGDWIYYSNYDDNKNIYRIRTDGNDKEQINDDSSSFLNVAGNWIYYRSEDNYKIYRIRTDGSDRKKLNDERSYYINVVDDWIYYESISGGGLYKIRIDGNGRKKLSSDGCLKLNVVGDWIYYDYFKEGFIFDTQYLCKIRTNGKDRLQVD